MFCATKNVSSEEGDTADPASFPSATKEKSAVAGLFSEKEIFNDDNLHDVNLSIPSFT